MGSVAAFRLSQIDQSAPTDRELIERTLAGDGGAFALLVERFQRKIYRVAHAIVRDDMEADTVTQDTFVQAYTHLARFEGRSELETWLTRIAINRSRDALRRRRGRRRAARRRPRARCAARARSAAAASPPGA